MIFQTLCAPVLLAASLIAWTGAARLPYRSSVFVDENSLSPVAKYGAPPPYELRDWVRIKHSGPRMNRVSPGGRVELECEANGSPPPSIQWFHNKNPVSTGMDENNSIGELRLGNVKSRLVIDCVTSRHQGSYTCVATAGTETAISPQDSRIFVQGNNASGLLPSCNQNMPTSPRIVTWSPSMVETIGNDVIMPCVSVGNPQPQVYWIDGANNLITPGAEMQNNDRYKILESGDLMIATVRWADMGHFTCVAESTLGKDTVTTFLYPMSKDR